MSTELSPGDAVVATRSFPRRWRSLFADVAEQPEGGAMLRRRTDTSPSPLALAGRAVDVLGATAERVTLVMRDDRPILGNDPPPSSPDEPEEVLAAMETAADELARVIEAVDASAWGRPANLHGEQVTALEVLGAGIDEAAAALRQAERTIEEHLEG